MHICSRNDDLQAVISRILNRSDYDRLALYALIFAKMKNEKVPVRAETNLEKCPGVCLLQKE